MAIKIAFDSSHNIIPPTLVLTTRSGNRLGGLLYHNLVVKQSIRQSMEISFSVNKNDYCEKNHNADLWRLITDFKLVWCKEWNCYFEINVTTNEEYTTDKEITAVSLGDAELSQINLYNIQINTEDDIARDDYEPTVLYNPNNTNASLLHRIMEKVPHYMVKHVDPAVANIQRTFTFDGKSLYDALQEIAEEIECVFDVVCRDGINGMERTISVFDLENYGNDTNILLTTDVLADNINYAIDAGAVKNCFRLEGGDDLMTATIRNCNPNGSGYIWYISNELKSDMSDELVEKLESYNNFYDYYKYTYNPFNPTTTGLPASDAAKVIPKIPNYTTLRNKYNALIDKYSIYSSDYQKIAEPMVGYPSIMEGYYNTVDFYYYLNDSLMPNAQMSDTNAQIEAGKLHYMSLKDTAVQNLSSATSVATVNSAIEGMSRAIVDTRYQVKVLEDESSFVYSEQSSVWSGKIKVTNYSDEEDTQTATLNGIAISGDYSNFVQQKLKVTLASTRTDTIADIADLFDLDDSHFKAELKEYSLQRLKAFNDACQGCIDVLIQQGIADNNNTQSSMYQQIYLPYYNKLGFIQSEMDIRQGELDIVYGKFDSEGGLLEDGMQTVLEKERDTIQNNLNFQEYLGVTLWQEFVAYRREDTYSNTNYVSDGLANDKLFARAMEFIQTAKDEIEKSATKQHTINAKLKNLLVMKEFSPIVKYFEVGNWLRLKVDGKLFKLRLVDYQIDFENLESIDITFSDIVVDGTEGTAKDILNQAASMATSYNAVTRQARKGDRSSAMLKNWVDDGLSLTTTKIIDSADNQEVSWDRHGLVCREYDSLSDSYSDKQVKLINKGVYVTDNNWLTAKAGIGNFTFFNPSANNGEGEYQDAYGVIADTLVGNLILGQNVGIYNTMNSITMNENGFTLTTNGTGGSDPQSVFTIRRKTINNGVKSFKDMFYIDSNGYVTINGGVKIDIDGESGNSTMVEMIDGKITSHITDELDDGGLIESSISQTASEIRSEVSDTASGLQSSISQTASQIKSTVSAAVSKYDTTGYTITLYGYGTPENNNYSASEHNGEYYLDQNTGNLYISNGSSWGNTVTLDLITNVLDDSISEISQTADQIKLNVSSSLSQYDLSSFNGVISVFGYGAPTASSPSASAYNNQYYLNQSDGQVYKSNGSSWSVYGSPLNVISGSWQSQITTNANAITSKVGTSEFGTLIQQSASDVKIAWNNISRYISFENAALNIYDNTSQDVSNLLMRLDNNGLAYYDYDSSATFAVQALGTPSSTGYAANNYAGQYYKNLSNNEVYLSDGISWINVDGLGSRLNMKTNRGGAYYYYEGQRLGKIGTNSLGTDHANHEINGLVFDLEPYAQYMTWAARTNTTDGYAIKLTYFQDDITTQSGNVYNQGFLVSADTYFRENVVFNGTAIFNENVSFNDSMATDIQMNNNKLYLDSNSYIASNSSGVLSIVGRFDKALTLTGYGGGQLSIGGSGVSINTDLNVTGTVTSGSDARLKTNIKDSKINALSLLSNIELKEFDWLTDETHSSVGIIAQQLQEAIPELVHENSDTGMLSIKVDRFIPFLVKSIQELYALSDEKGLNRKGCWTDYTSIKDKEVFTASIKGSKQDKERWMPPSKTKRINEDIILLDK